MRPVLGHRNAFPVRPRRSLVDPGSEQRDLFNPQGPTRWRHPFGFIGGADQLDEQTFVAAARLEDLARLAAADGGDRESRRRSPFCLTGPWQPTQAVVKIG